MQSAGTSSAGTATPATGQLGQASDSKIEPAASAAGSSFELASAQRAGSTMTITTSQNSGSKLEQELQLPRFHSDFFFRFFNQNAIAEDRRVDDQTLREFLATFPYVLQRPLSPESVCNVFLAEKIADRTQTALTLLVDVDERFSPHADEFANSVGDVLKRYPRNCSQLVRLGELGMHNASCVWLPMEASSGCSLDTVMQLLSGRKAEESEPNWSRITPSMLLFNKGLAQASEPAAAYMPEPMLTRVLEATLEALIALQAAGLEHISLRPTKLLLADSEWTRRLHAWAMERSDSPVWQVAKAAGAVSVMETKLQHPTLLSASSTHSATSDAGDSKQDSNTRTREQELLADMRAEHFEGVKIGGVPRLSELIGELCIRGSGDLPKGEQNRSAPEIIAMSSAPRDAEAVACWRLGILAYELACGAPPFPSGIRGMRMLFACVDRRAPPPRLPERSNDGAGVTFSPALRDFVTRCLVRDPHERPRLAQLRRHPLLQVQLRAFLLGTHERLGARSPIRRAFVRGPGQHPLASRHVLRLVRDFLYGPAAARTTRADAPSAPFVPASPAKSNESASAATASAAGSNSQSDSDGVKSLE